MHQDPFAALKKTVDEAYKETLLNCIERNDSELPHFVIATGQKVVSGEPTERKLPDVLKQALGLRGDKDVLPDEIQARTDLLTKKYSEYKVVAIGFCAIGNQLLEVSQRPA